MNYNIYTTPQDKIIMFCIVFSIFGGTNFIIIKKLKLLLYIYIIIIIIMSLPAELIDSHIDRELRPYEDPKSDDSKFLKRNVEKLLLGLTQVMNRPVDIPSASDRELWQNAQQLMIHIIAEYKDLPVWKAGLNSDTQNDPLWTNVSLCLYKLIKSTQNAKLLENCFRLFRCFSRLSNVKLLFAPSIIQNEENIVFPTQRQDLYPIDDIPVELALLRTATLERSCVESVESTPFVVPATFVPEKIYKASVIDLLYDDSNRLTPNRALLVSILETHKHDADLCDAIISCLFNLSSIVPIKDTIARPSYLNVLCEIMNLHIGNRNIVGKLAALFGRLAAGDKSIMRLFYILEANIMPTLFRALTMHPHDSSVQADCALALRNICMSDQAERLCTSLGGFPLAFVMIHNHFDNKPVLSEIIAALVNMSCSQESREFFDRDTIFGIRTLKLLLQRYKSDPDITVKVIRIIRNLSSTKDHVGLISTLDRFMNERGSVRYTPIAPEQKLTPPIFEYTYGGDWDRNYLEKITSYLLHPEMTQPVVRPDSLCDMSGYDVKSLTTVSIHVPNLFSTNSFPPDYYCDSTRVPLVVESIIPSENYDYDTESKFTGATDWSQVSDQQTIVEIMFAISNDYFNGIMGESINIRLEVVDAFAWTFASIACLPSNKTDLIFSHNILQYVFRNLELHTAFPQQQVTVDGQTTMVPKYRDQLRLLCGLSNIFDWTTVLPSVQSLKDSETQLAPIASMVERILTVRTTVQLPNTTEVYINSMISRTQHIPSSNHSLEEFMRIGSGLEMKVDKFGLPLWAVPSDMISPSAYNSLMFLLIMCGVRLTPANPGQSLFDCIPSELKDPSPELRFTHLYTFVPYDELEALHTLIQQNM